MILHLPLAKNGGDTPQGECQACRTAVQLQTLSSSEQRKRRQ